MISHHHRLKPFEEGLPMVLTVCKLDFAGI